MKMTTFSRIGEEAPRAKKLKKTGKARAGDVKWTIAGRAQVLKKCDVESTGCHGIGHLSLSARAGTGKWSSKQYSFHANANTSLKYPILYNGQLQPLLMIRSLARRKGAAGLTRRRIKLPTCSTDVPPRQLCSRQLPLMLHLAEKPLMSSMSAPLLDRRDKLYQSQKNRHGTFRDVGAFQGFSQSYWSGLYENI